MSLAEENQRLAFWYGARFGRALRDRDDVAAEALLGLVEAERRHDPARGPFASLAGILCRQRAWAEVKRQRRHERAEEGIYVHGEDGDELERADLPHVDPHGGEGVLVEQLREALADLPDRERAVLEARYGLTGEERTLAQVGEAVGLSRQGAAVAERRALGRLRRALTRRRR